MYFSKMSSNHYHELFICNFGGCVGGDEKSTSPESDKKYPVRIHFLSAYLPIHETINLPEESQVCPKKGINPTILLWGWDWDHQTYSGRVWILRVVFV